MTPQSGRATTRFKFWWFWALQLCEKTYCGQSADNMYTVTAGENTETKRSQTSLTLHTNYLFMVESAVSGFKWPNNI